MKRRLARVAAAGSVTVAAAMLACGIWICWPLSTATLGDTQAQGVSLEDRHGLSLRTTRTADGNQARWTPYGQIDPDLINAFVAVEDKRFWDHHGIDMRALARA
ncbi:MAG: transglycosylase domain-containing protein, partial [Gemmatimonadaceae bacterium]